MIVTKESKLMSLKNLHKSESDRMIAGVCGGFAQATDMPTWLWRIIFVVLACSVGTGILAYILLWIFMPKAA
jgi:phage shock protein PspC (stress-responsive transcriptional regulator)